MYCPTADVSAAGAAPAVVTPSAVSAHAVSAAPKIFLIQYLTEEWEERPGRASSYGCGRRTADLWSSSTHSEASAHNTGGVNGPACSSKQRIVTLRPPIVKTHPPRRSRRYRR